MKGSIYDYVTNFSNLKIIEEFEPKSDLRYLTNTTQIGQSDIFNGEHTSLTYLNP